MPRASSVAGSDAFVPCHLGGPAASHLLLLSPFYSSRLACTVASSATPMPACWLRAHLFYLRCSALRQSQHQLRRASASARFAWPAFSPRASFSLRLPEPCFGRVGGGRRRVVVIMAMFPLWHAGDHVHQYQSRGPACLGSRPRRRSERLAAASPRAGRTVTVPGFGTSGPAMPFGGLNPGTRLSGESRPS